MAILCPSETNIAMKCGEYLEKDNILYEVNFDYGICVSMEYIHVKKYITTPTKFYT